jgi:hypothetical protein
MTQQIRKFLTPPIFEGDKKRSARASLIANITGLGFIVTLIYSVLWVLVAPEYSGRLIFSVFALLITSIPFMLVRIGQDRLASLIFLSGAWMLVTLVLPSAGGTRAPFIGFYMLVVTIAALISGFRCTRSYGLYSRASGNSHKRLANTGYSHDIFDSQCLFYCPPERSSLPTVSA